MVELNSQNVRKKPPKPGFFYTPLTVVHLDPLRMNEISLEDTESELPPSEKPIKPPEKPPKPVAEINVSSHEEKKLEKKSSTEKKPKKIQNSSESSPETEKRKVFRKGFLHFLCNLNFFKKTAK